MAATTTPGRVSLDEYLRSDYEPDAEYVDGVLEERPMGQFEHAAWQKAILKWFLAHEAEWNVRVMPELRVQVAPTRFRVPDVTVLDRREPKQPIITRPPLAVFEILSPEDRFERLTRKLRDYAAMGIPRIWVVDPQGPRFFQFRAGGLQPAEDCAGVGDAPAFRWPEITALLD